MIRLAGLSLLLLLSGCVYADQSAATAGRSALIGKNKSQVLACAGVPDRTYRDGSTEFFSYSGVGHTRVAVTGNNVFGTMIYSGRARQSQCVVNIALRNDSVVSVNYQSGSGGLFTPDEACGSVVRSCL